ncbi:MAG: M48 family metallopeptidase [Verrucomicrobia bacterium]|nr:M48 family metallopeptidase [Verrucomicrobiota bacterium]
MWEQIRANRRRSAMLISLMGVVLVLLGYCGGEMVLGGGGGFIGLIVAVVVLLAQLAIYFAGAQALVLGGAGGAELSRDDCPRLFNIVEEMQLASGLPVTPKVLLIQDPSPNAFAFGHKPENYTIAVTSGLLHRLNRDELQGVIAHETGHLKNQDVQFMMLAAVMLGSIAVLSEIIWRTMRLGGRARSRSDSRGGGQAQAILLLIGLLLVILGPMMARLLYFACSRKREFLADASAAQFTRYPEGLASALEKIAQAAEPPAFTNNANTPMFIVNPLAATAESSSVFSTHPPTGKRVRILRSMAGAALADYEAAYRKAHGGGLIGAQSLQSSPAQAKRDASDEGPVLGRREARATVRRNAGYVPVRCTCGMEIGVPPGYERKDVRCVRCGSVWPVPAAQTAVPPVLAAAQPLRYTRRINGWESFRCGCGHAVLISPTFSGNSIRCTGCGRQIEVSTLGTARN